MFLLLSLFSFGQTVEDEEIIRIRELVQLGEESTLKEIDKLLNRKHIQERKKAILLKHKGSFYRNIDSFNLAQRELFSALDLAEKCEDDELQAEIHNNIANLYVNLGDYSSALQHYGFSLDIFNRLNLINKSARTSMNIGVVYENQGRFSKALNEYKTALKNQKIDSVSKAEIFLNLGSCYLNLDEYDSATTYLIASTEIFNHLNLSSKYNNAKHNLAYSYELSGNYEEALKEYKNCYKNSLEVNQKEISIKCLEGAMMVYNYLGNKDSVEAYYSMLSDLKNELYKNKLDKSIYEIETRYEVKKKDREILIQKLLKTEAQKTATVERKAKKQRTWILSLIIAAILLLLGGISLYFIQKNKIKSLQIDQHEKEINELIQQQEQAVYQTKLETENRERKHLANELHDRVGGLLAAVNLHVENLGSGNGLERLNTIQGLVKDSISEIRSISHNLGNSLHSSGLQESLENFARGISASGKVEMEVFYNLHKISPASKTSIELFTIIKEMVSNTLKHAKASLITTQLLENNNGLQLMYEDNGMGFDPNKVGKGLGLKSIQERVSRLHGIFNLDSQVGYGTTIIIEIPYEKS